MARVIKASDIGAASPTARPLNLQDVAVQVRAVVTNARRQAAAVLRASRARARELEGLSRRSVACEAGAALAEDVLAAASRQGFEDGFAQGMAAGLERGVAQAASAADDELSRSSELLREMAAALTAAKADLAQQMQRQTLELAMLLTNKIVGLVAGQDIAAARHNLAKALELAGGGDVIVRVSPRQHRRLTEHCRELAETLGCGGVRVMADESITPGGVKVLCRGGEIDATIETQLANVAASLAGMGGLLTETETETVPAVPPEMTESSTRP